MTTIVQTRLMSQRVAGVPTPLAPLGETPRPQWLPVVATGVTSLLTND
ncbi:MAG: hypothetical protein V7K89_31845 [Nostoc sp.]